MTTNHIDDFTAALHDRGVEFRPGTSPRHYAVEGALQETGCMLVRRDPPLGESFLDAPTDRWIVMLDPELRSYGVAVKWDPRHDCWYKPGTKYVRASSIRGDYPAWAGFTWAELDEKDGRVFVANLDGVREIEFSGGRLP